MYDVSGLHYLQQSLVIGIYVKMLVCMVLSDRYRIRQEQLQCHGVEIPRSILVVFLYINCISPWVASLQS